MVDPYSIIYQIKELKMTEFEEKMIEMFGKYLKIAQEQSDRLGNIEHSLYQVRDCLGFTYKQEEMLKNISESIGFMAAMGIGGIGKME